ncbi:MAG: hypothetical protein Q4C76_00975 [Bacillota bacterium]|nr:hypothetical protein [Bacillota bacterium]
MKKWMCMLIACLTLSLLTACGGNQNNPPAAETNPAPEGAETMTCRVVREEDGSLLLARLDGSPSDVYTATFRGQELEEGDLVDVTFSGPILETYPAQLGEVNQVTVRREGFDDLCERYLDVLDDLMDEDEALAQGITQLGLDLSQTRLTPAERSAVALALGGEENLPVVEGTWQELVDQGYIDGEDLIWEDGLFLSIAEKEQTAEDRVTFDAQSWRSGLGAQYFSDCTAARSANGHWSDYNVGAYAVS